MHPLILCVDDNPAILRIRRIILEAHGYGVVLSESGETALRIFDEIHPDLVVLDYAMPGMNGDVVAREMRRRKHQTPLILLSAYLDLSQEIISPFDVYLTKGENPEVLLTQIGRLLATAAAA